MATAKSEYIGTTPDINVEVCDGPIRRCEGNEMRVLGVTISMQPGSIRELERRISAMWKALWARRALILDRAGNRRLRLRLAEKILVPVLMYGSCNWHITQTMRTRLKTLQLKIYRKILNVFRLPNESREIFYRRTAELARYEMGKIQEIGWSCHLTMCQ